MEFASWVAKLYRRWLSVANKKKHDDPNLSWEQIPNRSSKYTKSTNKYVRGEVVRRTNNAASIIVLWEKKQVVLGVLRTKSTLVQTNDCNPNE